ncbi:secretin N-terminal domain-containing protein [Deinococcus maricopensis]|uniref:Type II and III secretion system protein n=1 Tax=Deinococcus maricopensis (strain DSM 21211 / LMG 22137 / NRRL B-23946 / LB-34) TaxID=709986 RepID=E8U800_DEIML|nr:secretin N-terminal domain-containing protein [Deinococcus maricopensis]ADV67189.1 type II and III secretion system protein [Deinococcus maricopensis DSM 21211]
MNKRTLTLLLTAALGVASAQTPSTSTAATVPTATDTRLSTANVTIEIGRYAGPLSSLLAAIAKSAGYELILDANVDALAPAGTTTDAAPGTTGAATPAAGTATTGTTATGTTSGTRPVVYNFANKPFNEVWPLLMDIYGLSYDIQTIGGQPVLRVSATPIQRVIKLQNASAADAVNQIKLFFGTPTYSETQVRDAQGNVTGVNRTLADVKLDSPTLRIVADTRTNSLIVRGTNREVTEVQRLASQLDAASTTTGGSSTTAAPGAQVVQRVYSVLGQQADITALLGAQYPNLRVTPVGSTGQLVITGPQNQIEAALGLLAQVDRPVVAQSGPQVVQRVFQLVNAGADEVKATLEGTLQRDLTGDPASSAATTTSNTAGSTTSGAATTSPAQTGASATTAATTGNGATIISDKRTNSLIVRGTQAQVTQIAELIPQLDQVVPQINVQVRIQEINETAARTLGVDWNAGFGNFVVRIAQTGLQALFDPTRALAGINLGATLNALETQNMTKRVYDGSVTMQSGQRSVGTAGGAQNASSGASATIKSGGRLEVTIPSESGNIVRQIDYGVNLDFIDPQVAPDGTITLRVRGQVNQPASPITGGTLPNLLNFTNSEAQTTITFKSGQTVLLSGLLGTNESRNRTGVPFLSSLPVIGGLFGTEQTSKTQSQLLVVITGTVVR